jgi:hypothetical protein
MNQASVAGFPSWFQWKVVLLAVSLLANLFFFWTAASNKSRTRSFQDGLNGVSASTRRDDQTSARRKHQRERIQSSLVPQKIPVPPYIARQVMPGGLLDENRVTDKFAEALGMSLEERAGVDRVLAGFQKAMDEFLVNGSTQETDSEGRKWILTPNVEPIALQEQQNVASYLGKILGSSRGATSVELMNAYNLFSSSPIQKRFTIVKEGDDEVVLIDNVYKGKILNRGREVGTDNIRREFGKVIDKFAK